MYQTQVKTTEIKTCWKRIILFKQTLSAQTRTQQATVHCYPLTTQFSQMLPTHRFWRETVYLWINQWGRALYREKPQLQSCFFLHLTDVSSATEMECEIRSSCFPSSVCLQTKPMTVDPGSNITLDCSIVTGGLVEGITWEQAKQRVEKSTGSSDLVLQQYNSKNNGNYPCKCTAIHFPRKCFFVNILIQFHLV